LQFGGPINAHLAPARLRPCTIAKRKTSKIDVGKGKIYGGFRARWGRGAWGDLSEADKAENEFAVDRSLRILSADQSAYGVKFWIITEADRSSATVLLPSEY